MEYQIDNQNLAEKTEGEPAVELPTTETPADKVEGQLPDSAKEQTKQEFEKLKEHNKQLSEKLAQLEQQQPKFNSVLDEMPAQTPFLGNQAPAQVPDLTQGLVDENGYIDQGLLNKTLLEAKEAKDRAMAAQARIEKFEETQVIRNVHAKHPAINPYAEDGVTPNPNFDREFYDKVRGEIHGQMKKGYQDFEAAADKVAAELKAQSKAAEAKTDEETKKVISQREQASTIGAGKKSQSDSYEDLEKGLKKGDSSSIGQLLKASGY